MYLVLVYRIPQCGGNADFRLGNAFSEIFSIYLAQKAPAQSSQTRQGRMEFIKEETNKLPSQRGKDCAAALFYPAQQQRR